MNIPQLGVGIGYREELKSVAVDKELVQWLEVIAEHYIGSSDAIAEIRQIADGRPVVPHGIEMSIGTVGNDPQWLTYVEELAILCEQLDTPWFSDHLCFTKTPEVELATLAPLPRTRDVLDHVVKRANMAQNIVGRPFLLENISYHYSWGNDYNEAEFLTRIVDGAGCHLLLDLTNLKYNSLNHSFDASKFLASLPLERVVQVHLAGGVEGAGIWYDTHSTAVPEPVWDLFECLVTAVGLPAAMLERDSELGATAEIVNDIERIHSVLK